MNEFKVGLLALFAIAAVVIISIRITSNDPGYGDYVAYRSILNDASGIFPKTTIKVAGINSGRIKSIELTGNQALVTFEIIKRVKVTKASYLRIKSVGFLGDKYIDIVLNTEKDVERLAANSMIPADTGGGLEDMSHDASEIVKDLKAIVKSFKDSISPEGKESPLHGIVDNFSQVSTNIREITETIKRMTVGNDEKYRRIVDNLDKSLVAIQSELDKTKEDSLLADLKQIGPVLENLKKMSEDLKTVVADVRDGRGTVGQFLRDDRVADQVSETLAGVNKIMKKANTLQTEISLFASYNDKVDNKSDFNLAIYPAPERFYQIGIVTAEFGKERQRETTTVVNGVETIETKREVDKDSYRLNAQLGRRIQNWGLRAGLIESSGGVGVDYHFRSFGSLVSLEVFDFQKKLGPNLRFSTAVHFWNVVYGKVAVEDIISKKEDRSFTLGAGLKFTDEDLKGLVGFFL